MYFYLLLLFPLIAVNQLINFTATLFLVYSLMLSSCSLNCLVLILCLYIHFLWQRRYFLYLNIIRTDTFRSESFQIFLYFTFSVSHDVKRCFPGLWDTVISEAILIHYNESVFIFGF